MTVLHRRFLSPVFCNAIINDSPTNCVFSGVLFLCLPVRLLVFVRCGVPPSLPRHQWCHVSRSVGRSVDRRHSQTRVVFSSRRQWARAALAEGSAFAYLTRVVERSGGGWKSHDIPRRLPGCQFSWLLSRRLSHHRLQFSLRAQPVRICSSSGCCCCCCIE